MITASIWVPRGAPAEFPLKYTVDEGELARISKLAKLQLEDAQLDLDRAKIGTNSLASSDASSEEDERPKFAQTHGYVTYSNLIQCELTSKIAISDVDDALKEYDLEHYDDETVDEHGDSLAMFGNIRSLAYHDSNAEDPYITIKDGENEENEEKEELQILSTDNMLVAAKVEDEVAHLEIYVYEDEGDNLYVHHDIMLPAIPLCVEWLDLPVGKTTADANSRGNYVAVGTFDPDIELWDLDTIDCMYPNAILGQGGENGGAKFDEDTAGKKKKRKKSKKANDFYHVDAILSLAANRQHRNLLASSSADKTVKLWDLNSTQCAKSYSYHTDKVCSVAWHPKETTILLSGSYDRTIVAADMRAPEAKQPRWGVESDVETVMWDPHDSNFFYVTTENGLIHFHDFRSMPAFPADSKPIWKLQAHDQSVSSFDVNSIVPGFLATGSTDKEVKLWDVQPSGPSMVVSRNLGVGKVFSTKFASDPEVGFRLAVAGSKGSMQIWDTSTNAAVRRIFADKVAPTDGEGNADERIVGVEEDSSDSEDDGGSEGDGEDQKHDKDGESMDED